MARYGIVYMGSKEKILNLIMYIFERQYKNKTFVDLFAGGLSVSSFALQRTKFDVVANDLNKYIIALYNEIIFNDAIEFNKFRLEWISRELFEDIRDNPDNYEEWKVGYVLNVWSFGANQKDYLYAKDLEENKKALHMALVFDDFEMVESIEIFDDLNMPKTIRELDYELYPEKRLQFMSVVKKYIRTHAGTERAIHLERLENMVNLSLLESVVGIEDNFPHRKKLELHTSDYLDLYHKLEKEGKLKDAFIYCDPPYQDTKQYMFGQDFDYDQFWDWFRNSPYPIYVSSYSAPDDIKPLNYEYKRVLLDNGSKKNEREAEHKVAVENLYFNGKGDYEPTFEDLLFGDDDDL